MTASRRKAAEEAQRTYAQRLIETQENERKHIARELHDEIGQVLTSAIMLLKLGRAGEAQALLEDLIGKVRGLALDLRPSVLDHFGLAAALTAFCERFTAQTGVRVIFHDFNTEERRFTTELETAVYRIVQEALTNVARHAGVAEATVTLLAEESVLRVEIEDRGTGFDPLDGRAQSFGLTGMRERANIFGGRLVIDSAAGAGTRVVAELPL
jgi:signal transduction histidine kinase